MFFQEHEYYGGAQQPKGRGARACLVLVRVSQLAFAVGTFAILHVLIHFKQLRLFFIARSLAGFAIAYTFVGSIAACLLRGSILFLCALVLLDFLYSAAFAAIAILIKLQFPYSTVKPPAQRWDIVVPCMAGTAFMIGIPVQLFVSIFVSRLYRKRRRLVAEDEPAEVASIPNGRAMSETKDGAMDDADEPSATLQPLPAANPTPADTPAISNSTALRREPEQPSNLGPVSYAVAAPTVAHLPVDQRSKPRATPKIKPQSDPAGRRSQSDIPQEDGHRAERSSDGCGCWSRCKRTLREPELELQEPQKPRRTVPVPKKPSGPKLLTPRGKREPRPRYVRTSGSMARPWGLKPPLGMQY